MDCNSAVVTDVALVFHPDGSLLPIMVGQSTSDKKRFGASTTPASLVWSSKLVVLQEGFV